MFGSVAIKALNAVDFPEPVDPAMAIMPAFREMAGSICSLI